MSRQKSTVFTNLGGVRRCGGLAFFDKCLSLILWHRNRIAASSYVLPLIHKNGGPDFSKPPLCGSVLGTNILLLQTTVFYMPSFRERISDYLIPIEEEMTMR